jgi:hypothetical protein
MIGDSLFTKEELEAELNREETARKEYEAKLQNGFFKDGGVRKVVITNVVKEDKVSQKGNNYVLHTYTFQDVDTSQIEEVIDRDFSVTNALGPVKKSLGVNLKIGVTVLKLSTVKKGEREWNGVNFPVWAHQIELESNPAPTTATVDMTKAF